MPALHWAMTRSGLEMMNSGAPMAGRRRRSNKGGSDMYACVMESRAMTSHPSRLCERSEAIQRGACAKWIASSLRSSQ